MNKELPILTALRGIAAVMVVVFHARLVIFPHWLEPLNNATGLISSGFLWVDMFFVLSGLVMAWVYQHSFKSISWAKFIYFRFSRIYPVFIASLMALFIWEVIKASNGLTINLGPYFDGFGINDVEAFSGYSRSIPGLVSQALLLHAPTIHGLTWNIAAWSLSVEWLLYLGFAGLLPIATSRHAIRHIIPVLAVALYGSIQYRFGTVDIPLGEGAVFRGLIGFSTGIYLCSVLPVLQSSKLVQNPVLLLCIAIAPFVLMHANNEANGTAIYTLAGFIVLVGFSAAQQQTNAVTMLLDNPITRWLGNISLSVYLWHYPLLVIGIEVLAINANENVAWWFQESSVNQVIVATAVYIIVLLVFSQLSYQCLERPAQKWMRGLNISRPEWLRP